MIVPPLARRKAIDRGLAEFFKTHRQSAFNRAIGDFCRFYGIKRPRIEWYEYIDWGKTAGKTYENGLIHLIHPENWKRGRVYNSERMWIQIVYHEMGHYLFWTDAERKADDFALLMVRGLRRVPKRSARIETVTETAPAGTTRRRVAAAARARGATPDRGAASISRQRTRVRTDARSGRGARNV